MIQALSRRIVAGLAMACLSVSIVDAQTVQPTDNTTLKFALVFSRHGVRPPTKTNDNYNPFAFQNFPDWSVPAGNLTLHGAQLMTIMGGYYRQYFTQQGLLTGNDQADAANEYFYADNSQRTFATGQALAAGLLPSVKTTVNEQATGTDSLFYPVKANLGSPDPALATAAVNGRIGSNPQALTQAYAVQLLELESTLLNQTPPSLTWQPGNIVSVAAMPVAVSQAPAGTLVNFTGSIDTASTLAEIFILEYCEGFDSGKIAFGKLSEDQIVDVAKLHTADFDLLDRTPYLAQALGSNLLLHIVNTLNQAATGTAVPRSLGAPGQKLVMLVGHDNQLAAVGGLLRADWSLPTFANDDTPPGGAMVFELRQKPDTSQIVRVYYVAATMDQQHNSTPLSLDTPPGVAPIFLPNASTATPYFDIPLATFNSVTGAAINQAFTN
jgi:4-phytase / acid phosphatase